MCPRHQSSPRFENESLQQPKINTNPTIFVHNHLAAHLMEPRMDDAFDTRFLEDNLSAKTFSKKDESVMTRVTKKSARCLMSLAMLTKFVKHI